MEKESKESIVDILRKVTHAVKIFPFVVAFVHMVTIMSYTIVSDEVASFLDLMFYSSPLQVLFLLSLSKRLRLCKWHKMECLLPVVGIIAVFIDNYIYEFSIGAASFNTSLSLVFLSTSIVNAYHVFIKPNSRR